MTSRTSKTAQRAVRKDDSGVLRFIGFEGDDVALVAAIRRGRPNAKRVLFERYGNHVQRVLIRIMGIDDAIPELINETFLQAFSSIHTVRDAGSLKAWLSMIAVFTARGRIRKRRKRRVMRLFEPRKIQDIRTVESNTDALEALQALYTVLDELPADERIAFALRFVDGMGLRETAEACGVSMATIKRRISRAEELFVPLASKHPLLSEWIARGERWQVRI